MANTIYRGTTNDPVQLDPFQRIVNVNWGGNIGVLIIDLPEGINFIFDPLFSSYTAPHNPGDVIDKSDLAKFNDADGEHPAPISFLVRDSIVLSTLYGAGDRVWVVREIMRGAGDDPGYHVDPSPFPPDEGLQPNTFPNPTWQEYRNSYNETKERFLTRHPEGRWIEVPDLKSIGNDTLTTGIVQTYFGPGETWAELSYGEIALYHFQLVPYVPPHYNIFFVQQYNTILGNPDGRAPGNIGYAPYGFNIFEAVRTAPFGLGEEQIEGSPGRRAVRQIYFFDFKVIDKRIIELRMTGNGLDDQLPSYNVRFHFQIFSQSARFTLTPTSVTGMPAATYDQQRIFPYTQTGLLFRIDEKGFQ